MAPSRKIPTRFLKTHAGIFRVTVDDMYRHTKNTRFNSPIGKFIRIECSNLSISIRCPNDSTIGNFINITSSEKNPEKHEKLLRGAKAVLLMNLAFTILQEETPQIQTLEFEDNSAISYDIEDEKPYWISLALFELAFFQMTWYEKWFGARLLTDSAHLLYLDSKKGFSIQKPEVFSFQNKDLDELLAPLYTETGTWQDFFKELYCMNKKTKLLLPWYKNALRSAMGGILYSGQQWKIDIPENDKIKRVEYKVVRGKKQFINEYEDLSKLKFSQSDLKIGRIAEH